MISCVLYKCALERPTAGRLQDEAVPAAGGVQATRLSAPTAHVVLR
jgi:hypothetical protein